MQNLARRNSSAVAALMIVVGSLLGPGVGQAAVPELSRIGVEVDIEPHPEQEGAFLCTAKIFDPKTEEVVSAPRVTFLAGTHASVESSFGVEDDTGSTIVTVFKMDVSVDEDRTSARYSSRLIVGDEVVNRQEFRVRLPGEPAPAAAVVFDVVPATFSTADSLTPVVRPTDHVTASLRNAELRDVVSNFARIAGLDLQMHDDVEGTVTVELQGVPWRQALEEILRINDLGMIVHEQYVEVGSPDQLGRLD